MFKKTILSVFLFGTLFTYAQVGIGTVTPDPSSVLDINSTDKGLLIPRVALIATNNPAPITPAPVEGMMIYNTATDGTSPNIVTPGFYFWDGSIWNRVATGGAVTKDWTVTGNGDIDATTDFIGTTNAQALRFRTNDQAQFEITVDGRLTANNSGTPALPIYSFLENTNMGMYRIGAHQLGFSTNGTLRLRIPNANQVHGNTRGTAALPFYSFSQDTDIGMWSPGTNQLGFSTSGALRFTIPNANQVHANSRGTALLPFYSFSQDTDIGMWSPGENLVGFSTNGFERMRILNEGVTINTPTLLFPGDRFTVLANAGEYAINGYSTGMGGGIYGQGFDGVVGETIDVINGWGGFFVGDVGVTNDLYVTGTIFNPSDKRIKKNFKTIDNALFTIIALKPTQYEKNINIVKNKENEARLNQFVSGENSDYQRVSNTNNTQGQTEYGLIAQEVELILPDLVKEKKMNIEGMGEIDLKSVNYTGLIPILIQAVKEQQEMIENQESRIEKLEALVSQLVNKK